jgi:NAD(P)-dependent dehydrogenase (short-subunit alcohol dehydrogenase family)
MDLHDKFSLNGRTAIVTGASTGIGRVIAHTFAVAGADVVLSARNAEGLEEGRVAIQRDGGSATCIEADLDQDHGVRSLFERALDRLGRIDVLVNAAAAPRGVGIGAGHDIEIEAIHATFRTNFYAPIALTQLVARHMIDRGEGGSILHVTSLAGSIGLANVGAYSASKAALTRWAESTSTEWGPYGVRVNCIAPGVISTEVTRDRFGADESAGRRADLTALARLGEAEEVAYAALFLASPAASYITGSTLVVDGGKLSATMSQL